MREGMVERLLAHEQLREARRRERIQQTAQLEVLYREIVKALADLSVKNQDAELRGLLTSHGITVTVNPPGGSAPAPAPAEPARKGAQK